MEKVILIECSNCKGHGKVVVFTKAHPNKRKLMTCPICYGTGSVEKK